MVVNFGAGPAKLPREVMEKAQKEFLDWHGTGMSVMELSHRSADFQSVIGEAEANLRKILAIPDTYAVLFMQGGASGQFASVPLNFTKGKDSVVDYFVTGGWSKKAAEEARKYCQVRTVLPSGTPFTDIPPADQWKLSPEADYVYYCDNETVHGVEFQTIPDTNGVPLVADMSSNFCSRPFDVTKFAMVFAGAQKNVGPAGVTICIVRKDMLGKARAECPAVLNYKIMTDEKSLYNTPPTFSIYMAGLVFQWILDCGGVEEMARRAQSKSKALYGTIDGSDGFYRGTVQNTVRSRMNVPFRVANEELEPVFLKEATQAGMVQLKGHRSVGGIRASLYNAITTDEVEVLTSFMKDFQARQLN